MNLNIKLKEDNLIKKLQKTLLFLNLKDRGVHAIQIEFSGGGDDGDIDDVTYMGNGSNSNIPNEEYDLFTELSFEIIREKVNTVGDWINNEGGFGTIEINVQNQTYELDYNQRTTEGYNWSDCNLV